MFGEVDSEGFADFKANALDDNFGRAFAGIKDVYSFPSRAAAIEYWSRFFHCRPTMDLNQIFWSTKISYDRLGTMSYPTNEWGVCPTFAKMIADDLFFQTDVAPTGENANATMGVLSIRWGFDDLTGRNWWESYEKAQQYSMTYTDYTYHNQFVELLTENADGNIRAFRTGVNVSESPCWVIVPDF